MFIGKSITNSPQSQSDDNDIDLFLEKTISKFVQENSSDFVELLSTSFSSSEEANQGNYDNQLRIFTFSEPECIENCDYNYNSSYDYYLSPTPPIYEFEQNQSIFCYKPLTPSFPDYNYTPPPRLQFTNQFWNQYLNQPQMQQIQYQPKQRRYPQFSQMKLVISSI